MTRGRSNRLPSRPIYSDSYERLNFGFEVEFIGDELTVVIGARWGVDHNRDYLAGLELILSRLSQLDATLLDAWVDSQYTRRLGLDRSACRLPIRGHRYPVRLREVGDITQFRKDLLFRIGAVGLPPNAPGGHTPLKQIRLAVHLPASSLTSLLAGYLSCPSV